MESLEDILEMYAEKIDNGEEFLLEDYGLLYNVLEAKISTEEADELIKNNKELFKNYGFNPNAKMSKDDFKISSFKKYYESLKKKDIKKLKKDRAKFIDLAVSSLKKYDERKDESVLKSFLKVWVLALGIQYSALFVPEYTKIFNGMVHPNTLINSCRKLFNSLKVMNTVIAEKEKKPVKESYYGHGSTFDRIYELI